MIVAAGNPPEYNKAVREFDLATMDRMRKIEIETDFEAWRSYAERYGIHGAILSYLDAKKDQFYCVENTADGLQFVTARGWEDLSEMLWSYEEMGEKAGESLIVQYLQREETAHDFALYLALYYKYKKEYDIAGILKGNAPKDTYRKLSGAPFDERINVVHHLTEKLETILKEAVQEDELTTTLYEILKKMKAPILEELKRQTSELIGEWRVERKRILKIKENANLIEEREARTERKIIQILQEYEEGLKKEAVHDPEESFAWIKRQFQEQVNRRKQKVQIGSQALEYGFSFIEEMFGLSQEMVIFVTALSKNYDAVRFISEFGCDAFFVYHRELLFSETRREVLKEIAKYQK